MSVYYPGVGFQRASLLLFLASIEEAIKEASWEKLKHVLELFLPTLDVFASESGWDPLLVIRGMVEHPDAERRLLREQIQKAIQQTEKVIKRLEEEEPSPEECEELLEALKALRPSVDLPVP